MTQRPTVGCFLIASPTLRDPNFQRTVVLLCAHDDEGSMGLVINRPTSYTLAQALTDAPDSSTERLYWGGPVQNQVVLVLHRHPLEAPEARAVVDGMTLGGDSETLLRILGTQPEPASCVRVFAGYAGWGSGQLLEELRQRSWIVAPGTAQLVFDTNPDRMWPEALQALGPEFAHLVQAPLDPRVN